MHGRLRAGAHALMGIAMVAMVWPAVPGWLCAVLCTPAAVFFLGTAMSRLGSAPRRRMLVDVHHVAMAAVMVWMAAMPDGPVPCHGGAGPVSGAAAVYFWLAAAPFLTAPFRTGSRSSTGGSLAQAAMSLAMAVFLTIPLSG